MNDSLENLTESYTVAILKCVDGTFSILIYLEMKSANLPLPDPGIPETMITFVFVPSTNLAIKSLDLLLARYASCLASL